jgi:amino acid permease
LLAANLFAIFAMATSFLAIGLALKQMYNFDYNINKNISWGLAVIIPIAAFLIGIKEFIPVLAIAGGVAGGLQGIMIVLMHHNAKKLGQRKPEFSIGDNKIISILLVLMFVAGMAYEIIL